MSPTPIRTLLTWGILSVSLFAQDRVLHSFEKRQLSDAFFCEGATAADLDRDGAVDVVSGPYWYAGPTFEQRHEIYPPHPFDKQGYSDNFFAFTHDFDGDAWLDVLVVGFPGKDASWYRNPGRTGGRWVRHRVLEGVDNESPAFTDLDGDGRPELVYQTAGRLVWAAPDWSEPETAWTWHAISGLGMGGRFTHGLGVGDVDGDGRRDVITRRGWWRQPASLDGDPTWRHHPHPFAGRGGAQMFAYDVDGDGDNDVITAENAHGFGLHWFEQVRHGGRIRFVRHRIMGEEPRHNRYGVVFGNLHAMALGDMNGDGVLDIVTGNRYWAHGGRERADQGPPPLYWFELVRGEDGDAPRFLPRVIDGNSGVGTQVVVRDVDGDGAPDVVVGNKMGTFVHLHRTRTVDAKEWSAAQPRPIEGFAGDPAMRARTEDGVVPRAADGRELNLDFESGDLRDWTATGEAFRGMPLRGDTVHPRRSDSYSAHEGEWWVGTYEVERSDRSTGTLTSVPFPVTHPYASFLVGGGRSHETRVEIVLADGQRVVHTASGLNQEDMRLELADLREHAGKEIFLRLVDEASGGWGHVNFDHFRFHTEKPAAPPRQGAVPPADQKTGRPAREAARLMTVPAGFRVEVIASEPDLHQPIALAIDERGRLWVAEAYAYPVRRPEGKGEDRIVVFEDLDGDGAFETRTQFAGGLNLVSGLEVGFGGVWVGAAPYLMFIPDRDHDLKPDGPPEILLDGWGYHDTHETLNAFTWGPDGWLYGCHGVFTHSRVGRPGTPDADRTPLNAGVWRYHPTKRRFEVFAWGTSNPWGIDFDDHGQAFITACVIPHLYHVVQGARFQRQGRAGHFEKFVFDDIRTIADHLHYVGANPWAGNGVSGAAGGGHAHCGAMIYLGDSFPKEYRNLLFMGNVHGNRVNTDRLQRRGSGFVGRHGQDFLLANDRWFRAINLRYGPDGSVFLIDWYDRQACHRTVPEIWDRTNGRLYRIAYGKKAPVSVDLSAATDAQLVALHGHENDWYVRTARRLLQERGAGASVHRELGRMLRDESRPGPRRLRALWTLAATGGLDEPLGLELLDDGDEHVRAWAVQLLLEDRKASSRVVRRLEALAREDSSAVVRLYVASALQRLPHEDRWDVAAALSSRADDRADHNLPLMIWYGIAPCVREDPGRALELAAASRLPRPARYVVRWLASEGEAHLGLLLRHAAGASRAGRARMILAEMVAALRPRGTVRRPRGWRELRDRLTSRGDERLTDETWTLALIFGDEAVLPRLRETATARSAPREKRVQALDGLQRMRSPGLAALLHRLLDDPSLRLAALRRLADHDDPRTPGLILARFAAWPEPEREAALDTLASRPAFATTMLEAVRDGALPPSALSSATRRRRLVHLGDDEVGRLLAETWGRARPTPADKKGEIERHMKTLTREALARADRSHGRALFARTCMQCHTLFGVGRKVGPDLTGSNRTDVRYLLTNMIDPSAEVARDYQVTFLSIQGGRLIDGIVVSENDRALTIQTKDRDLVVRKDEIDVEDGKPARWPSKLSMMPEGQLRGLSDDDVRDLVAYLAGPSQVPMTAEARNLHLFFGGTDLEGWDGDPAVWSVEDGEIVGRSKTGLARNQFLRSHLLLGDFRLTLEVKLVGDVGNSGIQLRSEELADGSMRGYQADIGPGWWGKLYEEHGRGVLSPESGERHVEPGGWNTYEILAIGSRILTAINGHACVDLDDPGGARRGIIGFQVHSGGPTEVRFRNLSLELDPAPRLRTPNR